MIGRQGARVIGGVVVLAALVLIVLAPSTLKPVYVDLLFTILLLGYLCVAWNLVAGFAGQLSFAHGSFYGIGALVTATAQLSWGVTPYLGLLMGAGAAGLVGGLLGAIAFRRNVGGLQFSVLTLAFSFVVLGVAKTAPVLNGTSGVFFPADPDPAMMQFENRGVYVYVMVALLIAIVAGATYLARSEWGLRLQAVRGNERAAQAVGIDPFPNKLGALVLSAALTAIAGGFSSIYLLYFSAELSFGLDLQLQIVLATLLGGIGTVWGPVLGAVFLTLLAFVLRQIPASGPMQSALPTLITAAVMAVVILLLPRGLAGVARIPWVTALGDASGGRPTAGEHQAGRPAARPEDVPSAGLVVTPGSGAADEDDVRARTGSRDRAERG